MRIADKGFESFPDRAGTVAFLPLLPMTIVAGSAVGLDPYWVGVLVPNLAFCLGLVAFGRIAARVTGDEATAWRACLLLVAFPTSFYFSAPYQESLGLALTAWGIWAWMDHRPLAAGLWSGLATTARMSSVAFSVAIVAEWFNDRLHHRQSRRWVWPVAILGVTGVLLFFLYLGYAVGDPLAHLKAHRFWGRKPGIRGVLSFGKQFLLACLKSWPLALALVGITVAVVARRLTGDLSERALAPGQRQLRVGFLSTVALVGGGVLWWLARPLSFHAALHYLGDEVYFNQNNLAFWLILVLGISIWQRRGPFWGCLTLVPIALAASSGTPMSLARVALAALPAFIEAADLVGKRWFFWILVVLGAVLQAFFLIRFVELYPIL